MVVNRRNVRNPEAAVPYAERAADEARVEAQLSPDELSAAWREWADHGPQGPIEDDDEAEVP